MLLSIRAYWTGRRSFQTFLYVVGALLILSGLFHLVVFFVRDGSWSGPVSWRKPAVFGISFGLTTVTVGWIVGFLRPWTWAGWILAVVLALGTSAEVILVSMQRWRGVASHFNEATPFDESVFQWMGNAVILVAAVIGIVAIWSFISTHAPPSLAWAIRIGLVLLIAGQAFGGAIIANGLTKLDQGMAGGFSTFGAEGAMKVPHAVSMHGIQVLPFLAWLTGFAEWPERRRLAVVLVASLGYAGLVVVSALQTFSGLAPVDLSLLAAALLVFSIVLLLGAFVAALRGITGPGRPLPAAS